MGTPLPPIVLPPGVACPRCWGPDGPFTGNTPQEIIMSLHDFTEGPLFEEEYREELSSPKTITQITDLACFWQATDGLFNWRWAFTSVGSAYAVTLIAPPPNDASVGNTTDQCLQVLSNFFAFPDNTILYGGTASVYLGS